MKIDELKNIKEKSLSKMVGIMFDRFIIDVPAYSILGLYEKWKPFIDKNEKYYKENILQNPKARSGIFISQIKGTSIDDFIKKEFGYTVKRNRSRKRKTPDYTKEKYMKLCAFACVLHLRKYGRITDYAVKHILMCVLFNYFDRSAYIQRVEPTVISNEIIETENYILNCDMNELPGYSYEVDKAVLFYRIMNKNKVKKGRPKMPNTLEELTYCLTGEESGKMEQYEVIAGYYGVTVDCARRWMRILLELEHSKNTKKEGFDSSGLFTEFEKHVTGSK